MRMLVKGLAEVHSELLDGLFCVKRLVDQPLRLGMHRLDLSLRLRPLSLCMTARLPPVHTSAVTQVRGKCAAAEPRACAPYAQ